MFGRVVRVGLTFDDDWECLVGLAPDVPGLAPVLPGVLLRAQVGDDQRGLSAVRLQIGSHEYISVLKKKVSSFMVCTHDQNCVPLIICSKIVTILKMNIPSCQINVPPCQINDPPYQIDVPLSNKFP